MIGATLLAADAAQGLPRWLTLLLATACGLIVANIYYAQPLVGPIAAAVGLPPGSAGLIVTMSQVGYGIGLLLVVPLGDLVETRRLVLAVLFVAILALLAASVSTAALPFLLASLFIGIGSVAVQVLVPYAAHLAPEASRGRVVGNVMSGLMLGIMLSRPVSSLLDDLLGWHAVFAISAAVMVVVGLVLRLALPRLQPSPGLSYAALLVSMAALVRHTPLLRRRATYHAFLFGAFSVFWTTVPLLLARSFHLSQTGIAVFALVGVGGAVSAPLAGHAADRGWIRAGTVLAMLGAALAFVAMLTENRLQPHRRPGPARRLRRAARLRRHRPPGARPARPVRPRRCEPQPPQRPVHGHLLLRRRRRFRRGRLVLRPWRLDLLLSARPCPADPGAGVLPDRTEGSGPAWQWCLMASLRLEAEA